MSNIYLIKKIVGFIKKPKKTLVSLLIAIVSVTVFALNKANTGISFNSNQDNIHVITSALNGSQVSSSGTAGDVIKGKTAGNNKKGNGEADNGGDATAATAGQSSSIATDYTAAVTTPDRTINLLGQQPLRFSPVKDFQTANLDGLKRAVDSHIRTNYANMPKDVRDQYITYNPTGWHNYNFLYKKADGGISKSWLFNRGHLVGYQFCGINTEPKNLVIETAYFNQGSINRMDDTNPDNMLFYENKLHSWVNLHQQDWLDYQVTPIYTGNELIPRKIRLSYVGFDNQGNVIPIKLGSNFEKQGNGGSTVVILNNVSPNANIDYLNGTATQKDIK
jgi:DNA-entry nuclease